MNYMVAWHADASISSGESVAFQNMTAGPATGSSSIDAPRDDHERRYQLPFSKGNSSWRMGTADRERVPACQ